MKIIPQLINSLERIAGFDKDAFEKVHASGEQVVSIRINPFKVSTADLQWNSEIAGKPIHKEPIPWARYGYYLDTRPSFTFDPFFHAGCYYVQEASSMFLETALKQTADLSKPLKVLDLSAAPGGKSTHIQSLITADSLLVSNEVIRSRANILKDNIIKWGCSNVMVTNNDPRDFARLENYFDVVVVDAPCSGSGLFRREPEAIAEWSENNVQLCSQRQQRILADIWPALKNDGILIYSTCSYSSEEDEDILDWILGHFTQSDGRSAISLPLVVSPHWGIETVRGDSGAWGYRFWPYRVKGEGFFIACFQKKDGQETNALKIRKKPAGITKNERTIIEKWVDTKDLEFIKNENTVYAWPRQLIDEFSLLLNTVRVIYSGTIIGEIVRDKLVPHHALAMSPLMNKAIPSIEVDYKQSIAYLQRKEIPVKNVGIGWRLVKYEGNSLGWINALPNRINNYYPKELRILKDI